MSEEPPGISLKPIGVVRNDITEPSRRHSAEVTSEIVIDSGLTEALDGLEDFSHIIVLYWMRQITATQPPSKVHPMGREDLPPVGLFATRSPHRPNPIGKTTVRLLERRGNILSVQGLDAINGTLVIDIKPYIAGYNAPAEAKAPSWVTRQ